MDLAFMVQIDELAHYVGEFSDVSVGKALFLRNDKNGKPKETWEEAIILSDDYDGEVNPVLDFRS